MLLNCSYINGAIKAAVTSEVESEMRFLGENQSTLARCDMPHYSLKKNILERSIKGFRRITREGKKAKGSAVTLVWVCFILRPFLGETWMGLSIVIRMWVKKTKLSHGKNMEMR